MKIINPNTTILLKTTKWGGGEKIETQIKKLESMKYLDTIYGVIAIMALLAGWITGSEIAALILVVIFGFYFVLMKLGEK